MNRFILGPGLFLLTAAAWAQHGPAARSVCFTSWQAEPWIQVDAQTAIVTAGKKSYLVTVPNCSSFFSGLTGQVLDTRVCEGSEIQYSDRGQYVESCVIQDIVRYQVNPLTNAVDINEFDD